MKITQEEYAEEIRASLKESRKSENTDRFFIGLTIAVAVIAALISYVHTNRVIARKSSLVTCEAFVNQEVAQQAYDAARLSGDPVRIRVYSHLDANHDGIACNNLPK